MNQSVPQLAESLLAYRQLVRTTNEKGGEDAFLDGKIPPDVRQWIGDELRRIDARALEPGCFWPNELTNLTA